MENHPLIWNLSIAVSSGTLPVVLDVKTSSCGIQESVFVKEHPEPDELLSKHLTSVHVILYPCLPVFHFSHLFISSIRFFCHGNN